MYGSANVAWCRIMPQKFSCISQRTTTTHRPLCFIFLGGKWCAFRAGLGKLQKQIRFWSLIKNTPTKRLSQLEKSRLTEKTYSHAPIKTLIEMLVHQQPINVLHLWDPRALNETGLWIGGSLRKGGVITIQLGASWHNPQQPGTIKRQTHSPLPLQVHPSQQDRQDLSNPEERAHHYCYFKYWK